MTPLAVRAYTTSNAAGIGKAATAASLRDARSGLAPNDLAWAPLECWIGRVKAAEDVALPAALAASLTVGADRFRLRLAGGLLLVAGKVRFGAAVDTPIGMYEVNSLLQLFPA